MLSKSRDNSAGLLFLHSYSRLPGEKDVLAFLFTLRTTNDKRYAGIIVICLLNIIMSFEQGSILALIRLSTVPDLTTLLTNHAACSELQVYILGKDCDTITEKDAAITGPLVLKHSMMRMQCVEVPVHIVDCFFLEAARRTTGSKLMKRRQQQQSQDAGDGPCAFISAAQTASNAPHAPNPTEDHCYGH